MSRLPVRRRLIFSFLTIFLAAGTGEAMLRLLHFRYESHLSYMQFNFPRPHELYQVFEPDPLLLWRMRPGFNFGEGFEPLNRQGFRGRDFQKEKKPDILRIACLGDSVTFGRPEASYPALLETFLTEKLSRPVEVMNFGVPGYSSWQGRQLLSRVLRDYKPDAVILLFGWNDHWLAKGFADQEQRPEAGRDPGWLQEFRQLRLYQLVHFVLRGAEERLFPRPRRLRVPPPDYFANLRAMTALARKAGARVFLAASPSALSTGQIPSFLLDLEFIASPGDLPRLHEQYNNLVRAAAAPAEGDGAVLIDFARVFEEEGIEELFSDPSRDVIHPNAAGLELMARTAAEAVAPFFLSPSPEAGSTAEEKKRGD